MPKMAICGNKPQFRRSGQSLRKVSKPDCSELQPEDTFQQQFSVLKTLSEGEFSKVYLVRPELECNKKPIEKFLVLKACNKDLTNFEDFNAEMDLNYFLSPHPNIVTSYNVSFIWDNFHIYVQEYAPCGDLWKFIKKNNGPLPESQIKLIAQQLSCALEFIHSMNLIHRNIVPENILVFQKDLSLIKISDFGSMVPVGCLVTKNSEPDQDGVDSSGSRPRRNGNGCGKLAYLPPEICSKIPQEKYHCYPSVDVWQVGILLFACLTGGCAPWRCADVLKDTGFSQYCDWLKRRCVKTPSAFQPFTCRLQRLLKRMLEPKAPKRCKIEEILKYLKDDWLSSSFKSSLLSLAGKGMEKSPSTTNSFQISRSNSDCCQPQRMSSKKKISNNASIKRRSDKMRNKNSKDAVFQINCTCNNNNTGSWNSSPKLM